MRCRRLLVLRAGGGAEGNLLSKITEALAGGVPLIARAACVVQSLIGAAKVRLLYGSKLISLHNPSNITAEPPSAP